jgi:hypothetical protein
MYAGRLQARRVGGATVPAAPVFLGSGAGSARTTDGHCSRSVLGERIERRRSALAIGVDAGRLAGPWHVRTRARPGTGRRPAGQGRAGHAFIGLKMLRVASTALAPPSSPRRSTGGKQSALDRDHHCLGLKLRTPGGF